MTVDRILTAKHPTHKKGDILVLEGVRYVVQRVCGIRTELACADTPTLAEISAKADKIEKELERENVDYGQQIVVLREQLDGANVVIENYKYVQAAMSAAYDTENKRLKDEIECHRLEAEAVSATNARLLAENERLLDQLARPRKGFWARVFGWGR